MDQAELLREVIEVLERLGVPYLLVGSIASGVYGEPRLTQDIDVVVDLRPGQVPALCEAFPSPDYYVSREAALQAVHQPGQFNVIHPTSGNKIDFMVAGSGAWDRQQFVRRRRVEVLPHRQGFLAAPEDVILAKMQYYREGGSEKHLRDITGILKVSGEMVDRDYVARWAGELGVTEIWQAILRRVGEA